ncbi:MAG: hypothetical protein OXU92_00140 [Deltaproteobacteria bacterium]|nr:hypothetical protein [Deltaproteobacteria bacterium]MDD9873254.1 hypothetical protein [Deltaproteobacteria bacterium]
MSTEPPVMIAVTGANGVGKSTLAEKISKERGMKFICPDVPQGESRHEETLALAAQHIARRESYAHDDVFRKTKVEQSILKAKEAGYWIEAHIVLVSGPGTSIERVSIRGEKGGHLHSEEYIRKHYREALRYGRRIAREIADEVHVYNNEGQDIRKVMISRDNHLEIIESVPPWIESIRDAIEKGIQQRKNRELVAAREHRKAMASHRRSQAVQRPQRTRDDGRGL